MTDRNTKSGITTTGRDLRFAGTVAAGLCAGVLGVGAIAVPLVGWNDWPQALSTSSGDPITMSTATGGGATGSAGTKTSRGGVSPSCAFWCTDSTSDGIWRARSLLSTQPRVLRIGRPGPLTGGQGAETTAHALPNIAAYAPS